MNQNKLWVAVGKFEFEFASFDQWFRAGESVWVAHGIDLNTAICVDARGRIVETLEHFDRAARDGAYPVRVYRKQAS